MKIKTVLFTFLSLFMVGGLTSCGNAPLQLKALSNEVSWSKRGDGFLIQLDESTKLDGHDISNIEFKASKDDVTITKVAGFDDYPLTFEWKAVCMSAGTFTVSATLDNLSSNTLTFTVKEGQFFTMECNIPNKYQLEYEREVYDNGSKFTVGYTFTKLNDSYMLMSSNGTDDRFFEKIGNDTYNVYSYNTFTKTWNESRLTYNESEVLSKSLRILFPDPSTKTEEYFNKIDYHITIDGKEYPTTGVAYSANGRNVTYSYYSGDDGLKLSLYTTIIPTTISESCLVKHIKTVSEFPVNPPSAE